MKYLRKLSYVILAFTLVFAACDDDAILTITPPEAKFELQQPAISNVFLNFALPDNAALTLGWNDDVTGSGSYGVEMALEDTFASPVALGTTDANSFSVSVNDLNNAIRNAGAMNFVDVAVYVRITAGSAVSNTVLFIVTTFPTDAAEITSPAMGDAFVLSLSMADDNAMNVNWTDAILDSSLGADVEYTVEGATAGSSFASPTPLGVVSNGNTLALTHAELNAAVLGLGFMIDTAADLDIRIIARYNNANGDTLERISATTTVSVTAYNAAFPYLYFVGDATTAGWNNNNNNAAIFRSQDTPNSYFFTGYFSSGGFKLLEMKGSWHPQWGDRNGTGTLGVSNPDGSNEAGTFGISTAGYYTVTYATMAEGAAYTITPYDASTAPTYNRIGLIGAAIGGWGDGDEIDMVQDANDPHLWYANGVSFENGQEFLIRPNDDWNNGLWRYTGSSELYGTSNFATGGNNFPFNAPTGTYDVWFSDLDGSYVIIPNQLFVNDQKKADVYQPFFYSNMKK